ncbi:putative Regulator of chromosome condensation [Hypsibius exemplaris]|uniref:Regulator of chromosome condensation n=1 Tax=Hypsibius exemplaris TaxID=2072580 RepID=A0A9X6N987_HYPEX|nr:putative Regulator of chromosome condensation [Hypsibius exemplaris]
MAPGLKRKTILEEAVAPPKRPANGDTSKSPRKPAAANGAILAAVPPAEAPTPRTGELFVYGNNEAGQLGLEDPSLVKRYPFFMAVDRVGGHPIHTVVAGGMHSVLVNAEGQAWSWGCDDEGALGTAADDEDSWRPKRVNIPVKVKTVTAGDSHTAFLTLSGRIYLTGTMRDASGAFGLNSKAGGTAIYKAPFLYMDNKSRDDNVVKDVPVKMSSGANHFAVLNKKHEVHLLGDGHQGQLGPIPGRRKDGGRDGRAYFLQRRKVLVEVDKKFAHFDDVWCTPFGTFVKLDGGDRWWACGNNAKNQLGFPKDEAEIQEEFREVTGLAGKAIVKIIGTNTFTVALSRDGQLFVFGGREYLGLTAVTAPDETNTDQPVRHPACDVHTFVDVGCASNNATVAVTTSGDVFVWGSPSSSVVGLEEDDDEAVAQPTQLISKNTTEYAMFKVSVGGAFALLLGKKRGAVPMEGVC